MILADLLYPPTTPGQRQQGQRHCAVQLYNGAFFILQPPAQDLTRAPERAPAGPLLQLLPSGPAAPDPRAQDAQQRTRAHGAPGSERGSSPRILATGPRRILPRQPPG